MFVDSAKKQKFDTGGTFLTRTSFCLSQHSLSQEMFPIETLVRTLIPVVPARFVVLQTLSYCTPGCCFAGRIPRCAKFFSETWNLLDVSLVTDTRASRCSEPQVPAGARNPGRWCPSVDLYATPPNVSREQRVSTQRGEAPVLTIPWDSGRSLSDF